MLIFSHVFCISFGDCLYNSCKWDYRKKKGDLEKPKRAPQVYKEIFITLTHYILALNETIWNFQLYILHREVILVRILQLGEHDECIFDDNLKLCIFEMNNLILIIYIACGTLAVSSRLIDVFHNLNWYVGKPFLVIYIYIHRIFKLNSTIFRSPE